MFRKLLAACGLLACCAGPAHSIPAGEPWVEHPYFTWNAVTQPAVAVSARGDRALAWAEQSGDGTLDINAQFNPTTGERNDPIRVNTASAGSQESPAIASDALGNAVIVWRDPSGILARRVDAAGQPLGAEFQVSASPSAAFPQIGMDAFGSFVVAWEVSDQAAGSSQILARRYLPDATALGEEFQVDAPDGGPVGNPAVAMGAWGEFVIAWEQAAPSQPDVFVRSYAADGTADAPESIAGALPALSRRAPTVGMDAHGRFVVAWDNEDLGGSHSVQARQYLAGGTPVANEFSADTVYAAESPAAPSIGMGPQGDFVVVWRFSSYYHVKQQFAPDGTRVGRQIYHLNYGAQYTAAMDANGNAFIGFLDENYGQPRVARYIGREPIDLAIVLEDLADPVAPGERVRHRITVSNRHGVSAETGIPEIDAAIGRVDSFQVYSTLSGAGLSDPQVDPSCTAEPYDQTITTLCYGQMAPGANTSLEFSVLASEPTHVEHRAYVHAPQADPDGTNNDVTEVTVVPCSDGSGPGTVAIASAPTTVNEGGSFGVQLARSGGACGTVSTEYVLRGSFNGQVRALTYGTVTWENGQQGTRTVTVSVPQDSQYEEGETAEFSLKEPTGGLVLGTPSSAVIAVANDDVPCSGGPGTIAIASGPISVEEGETAMVQVERVGGNCGAVSVSYDASASADNPATSGTLQWPSGQDGVQVVSVATTEDNIDEGAHPVEFTIGWPEGGADRGPAWSSTITILDDDDAPTITITPSVQEVTEGPGNSVSFQLTLSRPSELGVSVPFTLGGSATPGVDYWVSPPSPVQFTGTVAVLDVRTMDDQTFENSEVVYITFGEPTNAVMSGPSTVHVTLRDNEGSLPQISFVQAAQIVREGPNAYAQLNVQLSYAVAQDVQVMLIPYGNAYWGKDWAMDDQYIVIPAGSLTGSQTVQVVNNWKPELDKKVTFDLANPVNATLGPSVSHVLTIRDDDPAPLKLRETLQGAGTP